MTWAYKAGAIYYTWADIERIAYQHGRDGIMYYPPCRWGKDGDERNGPSGIAAETAYHQAYERGKADRQAGVTSPAPGAL